MSPALRPEIERAHIKMLIGGKLVDASSGATRTILSPADGRPLADVAWAGIDDVHLAVEAARRAADSWRFTDLLARRQCITRLAAAIEQDAEPLAYLDAVDSGSPLSGMRQDVAFAPLLLELMAGYAFSWGGRSIPVPGRCIDFTMREPFGVTARMVPFNHPLTFAAWKIAAPLLTGNTVVLKLPDQTPLSGLRLAAMLADIFPAGVVNVLTGDGRVVGDALVRHPDVARIAFIGSVETGKSILRAAADRVVPVTLELGGKNPMIVCADADVDAAADAAVRGMNFGTQGQSCGSYSRLFLHRAIADEVLARVVAKVSSIRVRHPLDHTAEMGAVVDERARDKIEMYVEYATSEGAVVLTGGRRPIVPGGEQGFYYEPTVLGNVGTDMRVAREEVFGPVLSVLDWTDQDEVIEEANKLPLGLTANVHTRDLARAMTLAERIEAGSVAINGDGAQHWLGAPFGGFKESGYGKEESVDELVESTREKNINIRLTIGGGGRG